MGRDTRAYSLDSVKTQQEDDCLEARKRPSRNRICWHLDPGLSRVQNCKKINHYNLSQQTYQIFVMVCVED